MNRYKTILAVDDTPSNLDILVDILDRYEVFASTDGYDALKILKDKNIDLILLDIVMPSLNGFDLCKMLKEDPKTKDIPVIFITSKSDEETIEQAYDLGGIDYVTKPFKVKELISRVNTHLSLSNQNKELADKVEEETSKRLEQQNILVRNSRLAAMGEMMSAITHQWKQPLNAISVNVTSMEFYFKLDEVDKDEMLNHIKQINSSISFMNETVDDFKNYFNKNKTRSVFNIRKEVNRIYNMIKPQLLKENIEFIMDIDDDIKGYGVASEFKHIILNLLSNAKDSIIQNNTRYREISIIAEKTNNSMILLKVQDTGGGIPEDIINDIFDDYFTTKGKGGTGIGLSMTKLIVEEEMNGTISVCNNKDGALFSLNIPMY